MPIIGATDRTPTIAPYYPSKAIRGKLKQIKPNGPTLRFLMNPETVTKTPAVGGWEEISRPLRKPATEWRGRPVTQISFTLIFDRYAEGVSVERELATLEGFGTPRASQKPPPILRLIYGGAAGENQEWVLTALDYGEEIRNAALQRTYAVVGVTLTEYVDVEVALTPAKRQNQKAENDDDDKPKASGRVYTVKKGDTLPSIAAKELGDHKRWREIAKLNNIRDPDRIKVGQRLRMPRA